MKSLFNWTRMAQFFMVMFFMTFAFGTLVLAQDAPLPDVPTQSLVDYILGIFSHPDSVVGSLAIAAAVVQGLVIFLKTPLFGELFKNVSGAVRLLIVTGLSLIAGTLALMIGQHLSLGSAILNSGNLAALMVFANQIYKQFFVKSA